MMGTFITALVYLSCLLSAVLLLFYLYVQSLYKYFEKRSITFDRPTFPFGSFYPAFLQKKSFSLVLADIHSKYKKHKTVGFFSFWKKQVLITDPVVIKNVLVKDFDVFADRGVYYNKRKDPLSAHLFALDGKEWKVLRAKLSPTFTSGKMKGMFSNVVECAHEMLGYAETAMLQNRKVDCLKLFSRFGLAVVANIAFGLDSDALKNEDSVFVKMAYRMLEPTVERFISFMLMFNDHIARMLNVRVVPQPVSDYFLGMVSETVKYREANDVVRSDYLQLLLELRESGVKDPDGGGWSFSDEEMAAQSFVFILAGSETTSATLSFCLYELALNPPVQHKLLSELDSLQDVSYESVNKLEYMDLVIDETLRMYPPLGFLNRLCSQDYRIPGTEVVIEKNTQVYISVHGLHHDPELFPEPEKFLPERFSKENRDRIKPYSYMPFGEGPRFCIGMRFARVTMKVALAMLLRHFHVRLSGEVPVPANIEPRTIVTLPAGGMWLHLEPRSQKNHLNGAL